MSKKTSADDENARNGGVINFSKIITPGIEGRKDDIVAHNKNTASAWGSGGLDVFATPAMVALMEGAAVAAVDALLPSGWSTVGTELAVRHISATPSGMKVSARAELAGIDGRALSFRVEAFDEAGKIGEGTHGRFVVENVKFLAGVESKKAAE